ncbi:MAG: carboxy terminal-processing peptidase [Pseudomonadota bacterium]|nr:carboxy terminal-processing peptidase [Pseudomonadota bacterium]
MNKKIPLFGFYCLLISAPLVAETFETPTSLALKETEPAFLNKFLLANKSARQQSNRETFEENSIAPLSPLEEHKKTTINILAALRDRHYQDVILNDASSARLLQEYVSNLDPSKSFFLKEDIEEFSQFRTALDEMLERGDVSPAFHIFNRYLFLSVAQFERIVNMLEKGLDQFDFTIDEHLLTNREKAKWELRQADLDDFWRKRLKDSVINLRLAGKQDNEIADVLIKRFKNRIKRTKQTNSEDVFQIYINSFTRSFDPHTQYLSPKTFENFNINMSLSLEGIGAVLQTEDEYTKVVELVSSGPADKSGSLQPNDKIIGVGQGKDGVIVDVIGWRLDDVVNLIRGEKNTVVTLEIISANELNTVSKKISITRKKVELEEQTAKSEILEIEVPKTHGEYGILHRARKIGVISIPTFYVDFDAIQRGEKDFRSTTRDVTKLIEELTSQQIEGLVIDLRGNGGGSLEESRTLTGLFIDRGPIVQIRTKNNRVDILRDRSPGAVYDGPLAVLVNRLSASASEIFAGAIQDYERGIIVGNATFGKGTVQSLFPLNRGQLKLTQAKFYRVSGDSTQERGISPDIKFPFNYDPEIVGESTLEKPLPWDRIIGRYVRKGGISQIIVPLRERHNERVKQNPEFLYQNAAYDYRKTSRKADYVSLQNSERRSQKDDRDNFWLNLENKKREALGRDRLTSLSNIDETEKLNENEMENPDRSEQSLTGDNIQKTESKLSEQDPFLLEAGNIVVDLISLQRSTSSENTNLTSTSL